MNLMMITATITVTTIKIQFPNNLMHSFDIPKLRGFFAHRYPKAVLIHNHFADGRFRYAYPTIQFKAIDKIPTLIGLQEGLDILKEVFQDVDELVISGEKARVWEKSIQLRMDEFGQTDVFHDYQFISPWMALKEENFATFKTLNKIEKQHFLRHLLRENLKTVSKGFHYNIPAVDEIQVAGYFRPHPMNFKNIRMTCFTGEFTMNFILPDFLGLGKQVARGFGTIKRVT